MKVRAKVVRPPTTKVDTTEAEVKDAADCSMGTLSATAKAVTPKGKE